MPKLINCEEEYLEDAIDQNIVARERKQDATEDVIGDNSGITDTQSETENQVDAEPLSDDVDIPFLYEDHQGINRST